MNNETSRKVSRLINGRPIGAITLLDGTGYGKDEAGRIFSVTPVDHEEEARRRRWAMKRQDRRHFSFGHMRHISEITRELSNKYCGYILLLQPHIQFGTNTLVSEGRDGRPLKLADLAQVWNVTKRTAGVIVGELEAHSIVFETSGTYAINERYHFRKKSPGDVDALIKTFFTTLRAFDMTAADLGFVYKLLPHVHYETNIVCADPFVENPEDVRFLNERQIADVVGMYEDKAAATLKRLRKAGVVGEWVTGENKREKLTVLNPFVFYRKSGEPDGTLRALFATKRFGA